MRANSRDYSPAKIVRAGEGKHGCSRVRAGVESFENSGLQRYHTIVVYSLV